MKHTELASLGGKARAAKLTAAQRKRIAEQGGRATREMWRKRKAEQLKKLIKELRAITPRSTMSTSEAGRRGGIARKQNLSSEEIAAIGRKGGEARAKKLSPAKRRNIAKKAGRVSAQRKRERAGGLAKVSAPLVG